MHKSNEYDRIVEYINDEGIDSETQLLICAFAVLWNRYEDELYENYYKADKLQGEVNKLCRFIIHDQVDYLYEELKKYLTHKTNYNYGGIKTYFNISDKEAKGGMLNNMINGKNDKCKLHFLLLICARVRNNMFHGIKDRRNLNSQKRLFEICNMTLMEALRMHGFDSCNVAEFEIINNVGK
ncbi:MAG: hypothetical protein Q4F56_00910 [Candidatus Saccharibacteria bacterium]|nr:hypothetical protein [Candidatus Saccharibacteria bacterium]